MRLTFLPALLGVLAGSLFFFAARAEEPFRDLAFDAGAAAAKKEKKILLVDFYATWCGPCKLMDRTTWKDPKVQEWIRKNAVAVKVQGDKQREISSKYRVTGFPTVIFFKPDGVEAGRVSGYRPPEDFLLAAQAAGVGKDPASFLQEKKLPNGKPDPSSRLKAAVAFAQTGRLEAAEAELRWCVESGPEADPAFLSSLPQVVSLLAQLGQIRPSAQDYLKKRRDAAAQSVTDGMGDTAAAEFLGAANDALGDPAKTLDAYDRVKAQGPSRAAVREVLYRFCFRQLYSAGRYEDILRDAGDSTRLGTTLLANYRNAVGANPPAPGNPQAGAVIAFKERVIYEASMLYEVLLVAGKSADARRLAEQILDFSPTGTHYALFLDHAQKAGKPEEAAYLRDRGSQLLPSAEVAALPNPAIPLSEQQSDVRP
jgi:thioredoxin-related protein